MYCPHAHHTPVLCSLLSTEKIFSIRVTSPTSGHHIRLYIYHGFRTSIMHHLTFRVFFTVCLRGEKFPTSRHNSHHPLTATALCTCTCTVSVSVATHGHQFVHFKGKSFSIRVTSPTSHMHSPMAMHDGRKCVDITHMRPRVPSSISHARVHALARARCRAPQLTAAPHARA
jgi:hypothetical protein